MHTRTRTPTPTSPQPGTSASTRQHVATPTAITNNFLSFTCARSAEAECVSKQVRTRALYERAVGGHSCKWYMLRHRSTAWDSAALTLMSVFFPTLWSCQINFDACARTFRFQSGWSRARPRPWSQGVLLLSARGALIQNQSLVPQELLRLKQQRVLSGKGIFLKSPAFSITDSFSFSFKILQYFFISSRSLARTQHIVHIVHDHSPSLDFDIGHTTTAVSTPTVLSGQRHRRDRDQSHNPNPRDHRFCNSPKTPTTLPGEARPTSSTRTHVIVLAPMHVSTMSPILMHAQVQRTRGPPPRVAARAPP